MKTIIAILMGCMLSLLNLQAEVLISWHGIDTVRIEQKVDVSTSKIYVYGYSTSEIKNAQEEHSQKAIAKQQAAFAELGKTVVEALKKEFPKADIQQVSSPEEAPADGILVVACLKEIAWGSKALRMWVGYGAGNIHAYYSVQVSDARGQICEVINHRFHDTTFRSEKATKIIGTYNKVIAKDLLEVLRELKK